MFFTMGPMKETDRVFLTMGPVSETDRAVPCHGTDEKDRPWCFLLWD